MTEPVRRRLEQPSAEKAKRSGCLTWGAVLGVLVGIMLGIYALPPILRHYYGEEVISAGEAYEGDGKTIKVALVGQASDPLGEVEAGKRREDYFVEITVRSTERWTPEVTNFSLELKEIEAWQLAAEAESEPASGTVAGVVVAAGEETRVRLHFIVVFDPEETESVTPEALHLSDPRVKWILE